MKPRLLAILAASALLTGFAACSSGDEPAESGPGNTSNGAFPVTVSTEFGSVTVEEEPERVVALGWGDAETALALGVQPVGASDWLDFGGSGVGPWAEDLYDEAPELIETLEPSYEAVAALEPDLILDVKSSGDEDRYEQLSQIAPTVGVPEGKQSFLTSMEEQVTLISTALGVPEEGEQLLDDIDQRFTEASESHPEFKDKTVSVSALSSEGWGAYIAESERVMFMQRLGLTQNPEIEELTPEGFSVQLSQEQIGLLDADLIVVFPIGLPASDVTDQALFQRVPAVEDGRVIVFDEDDEAIRLAYSANTVLSVPYALDEVVPLMSDALG